MVSMLRRVGFAAILLAPSLAAQFSGLSSTADGSSLYFVSTLRLKNLAQPLNGKIYVFSQNGVSLFRAQEVSPPPPNTAPCSVGGFSTYTGAETSSIGVVALSYLAQRTGSCSSPSNIYMTQLVTAAGESSVAGIARLSSGGRYAIVFLPATGRIYDPLSVSFLDLQSGVQTPISVHSAPMPQIFGGSSVGGRVIANDGTAVLTRSVDNVGYILKPGTDPMPFPIANGAPLVIDASGSKVLYQQQGVNLLDLKTLASTPLIAADVTFSTLGMSDDARRVLYVSNGQVHLVDTTTLIDRTLTNDPATITQATISSDGKVVFAETGVGRLLKIGVDDGSQTELIGRTPYLNPFNDPVIPGFNTSLMGSALADSTINGTVPFNYFLGNVTMWIGQRKVPMTQLTPTSVSFIVPWDVQGENGSIRMLAETAGDNTPFYFPEAEGALPLPPNYPRAGVVLRQDWSQTYVGPVNTGEIIHVYAAGFGPVVPEVPDGAAAPSTEPLSRITQSFTCSNSEILYAGLAPGAVERAYQIDMRIGPTPGYQQFICSLGAQQFAFLTLNVVVPSP